MDIYSSLGDIVLGSANLGEYPVADGPVTITVPTGSLLLTAYAPSVILGTIITIPTGSLLLTSYAPAVVVGTNVTVPTGSLTLTSYPPSVVIGTTITVPTASLTLTAYAPTLSLRYSNIQDILYTPAGQLFNGSITIRINWLDPLDSTAPRTLVPRPAKLMIQDGVLNLLLTPNPNIQPAGSTYTAKYWPKYGMPWAEQWEVPASNTPLTVGDVRI
jgi:hypothetical protein